MKTYDELLAERDALVAQVEALSDALKSGVRLMRTTGQYSGWHEKADEAESLVNQELTTQQHLAEIKAEAGRAGYVAGACGVLPVYSIMELVDIEADARNYAAKIRNTGTWLKDSNVNGGKRQGGAE